MSHPAVPFWDRVDASGDCWEWTGGRSARGRYGAVAIDGHAKMPHRVAWELLVGPIPSGMELDHLCRNRYCVNPDHLEPVSHRTNILRGTGVAARNARRTTCPKGHPYVQRPALRECPICRDAYRQTWVEAHKEELAEYHRQYYRARAPR